MRPFSQSAGVICRGCSGPLQRVIVDFGADHAFGQVPDKLQVHYGIRLGSGTIRLVTERHAAAVSQRPTFSSPHPDTPGCAYIVGEMDGSMIPIVEMDETSPDQRKGKRESWKEARLSLAHDRDKVTCHFGVEFQEGVDRAGQALSDCARRAGFGRRTYLHAVGDGAVWLREQVGKQFGDQGHYLADFYHVCEYLAEAATSCTRPEARTAWMETQKEALKRGRVHAVIEALMPHIGAPGIDDSQAPVRACHRYLGNRLTQPDYVHAQANNLPIGSGEIESAHRHIIQKRIKLPGAWWKIDNARNMMKLRVMRANGEWDAYWPDFKQVA